MESPCRSPFMIMMEPLCGWLGACAELADHDLLPGCGRGLRRGTRRGSEMQRRWRGWGRQEGQGRKGLVVVTLCGSTFVVKLKWWLGLVVFLFLFFFILFRVWPFMAPLCFFYVLFLHP